MEGRPPSLGLHAPKVSLWSLTIFELTGVFPRIDLIFHTATLKQYFLGSDFRVVGYKFRVSVRVDGLRWRVNLVFTV